MYEILEAMDSTTIVQLRRVVSALLVALVGRTATYRQIMATLGHDSRPVVIGEENNPN